MASRQSTVDFLLEQMAEAGEVTARKMFGEYGLYCDGKIVALVADDQLFVKPTAAGKAFIGDYVEGCAYPGAKPSLLIPGDRCEDHAWLTRLIQVTTAELSAAPPKPRRRGGSKKK